MYLSSSNYSAWPEENNGLYLNRHSVKGGRQSKQMIDVTRCYDYELDLALITRGCSVMDIYYIQSKSLRFIYVVSRILQAIL